MYEICVAVTEDVVGRSQTPRKSNRVRVKLLNQAATLASLSGKHPTLSSSPFSSNSFQTSVFNDQSRSRSERAKVKGRRPKKKTSKETGAWKWTSLKREKGRRLSISNIWRITRMSGRVALVLGGGSVWCQQFTLCAYGGYVSTVMCKTGGQQEEAWQIWDPYDKL